MISTHSYALEQHNKDTLWYLPLPQVDNISQHTISEDKRSAYKEHKFSQDNIYKYDFDYHFPPLVSQYKISQDKFSKDNISQDNISQNNITHNKDALCVLPPLKTHSNALEQHNKDNKDKTSESYTPCLYVFTPVEAALDEDNKDKFATLIKSLPESEINDAYCTMFYYDAINCFAAMLAGEFAPFLDIDYFLAEEEDLPLFSAARLLSCSKITAFLIDKGYTADLRSDFISEDVCLKDALPLNVALESYRVDGWRNGSAIHFFTSFVNRPRICKNIALLARNTREIKHEFFKYLKQGKMVEVGILLAVALDCILAPSTDKGEDDINFKDISEMHKYLSSEILKLSVDATIAQYQLKTQLLEMKNTLQLLEIFDKIGDKFIALTQTTQNGTSEVESLIKDAGFDVDMLKINTEFRRSVRLHVVDKGLLPSSFDEEEFCEHLAKYGLISPKFPIRAPYSFSLLPSRVTVIIGETRLPGIVDSDEEV